MKKEWVLDTIYPGIDSEQYNRDFESLKDYVVKMNNFANETMESEETLESKLVTYLSLMQEYSLLARKLYGYNSLRTSIRTDDIDAIKQMDVIETIMNDCVGANTRINAWLSQQVFSNCAIH